MLSHIFGSHSKQFQSNDEMLLAFKHFFNINDDLSENELLTQVQSCYHDCMIDNDLRDNLISFVSEHLNLLRLPPFVNVTLISFMTTFWVYVIDRSQAT